MESKSTFDETGYVHSVEIVEFSIAIAWAICDLAFELTGHLEVLLGFVWGCALAKVSLFIILDLKKHA